MTTHSLNGVWKLRPALEFDPGWRGTGFDDTGWDEQNLPAFWQRLPNFADYNGKMVYRKAFSFGAVPGRMYRIRLAGVMGTHRAFLNGYELGGGRGYFVPHEYDVTGRLRNENVLVIETDNESDGPGGIWRPVTIVESGRHFIMSARIDTRALNGSSAALVSTIRVWSPADVPITLKVKLRLMGEDTECAHIEKLYFLVAGENDLLDRWNLSPYQPWWTHDQGKPALYEAVVEVADEDGLLCDRFTVGFGIRTVQVKKRALFLNGRELPIRLTATRARRYPANEPETGVMECARLSGANLCRVLGHVEPPEFYQAADAAGILLWQDVPKKGIAEGRAEERAQAVDDALEIVRELGGHPSVALWHAGRGSEQNAAGGFLRRLFSGVGRRLAAFRTERLITRILRDADGDRPVISSIRALGASPTPELE